MKTKIVSLPGTHDINIAPVQKIIDHPLFQALRNRHQLDSARFVFPSANHTRFEHSLGTYSLTKERAQFWVRDGLVTEKEGRNLSIFGLLHDIGHGPYSHCCEELCQKNHEQNGLELLEELRTEIEASGGDFQTIKMLMEGKLPLAQAVTHHPLGTDKIDYLIRDASRTNEAVCVPAGQILNYTHFFNGELAIDAKICDEVMQLQRSYFYMYKRVYFRKACLTVKRLLQKMFVRLIEEGLTERALYSLTDSELDSLCVNSKNPQVRSLYDRLLQRQLPKVAVVLRPEKYFFHERVCGKPIKVKRTPWKILGRFNALTPFTLSNLERQIAELTGLPEDTVFLVPNVAHTRFIPRDIRVHDFGRFVRTLKVLYPCHYEALTELAEDYAAVRVAVPKENREQFSNPDISDKVIKHLFSI